MFRKKIVAVHSVFSSSLLGNWLTFLTEILHMHGSSSAVLAGAYILQGNLNSWCHFTQWFSTSILRNRGAGKGSPDILDTHAHAHTHTHTMPIRWTTDLCEQDIGPRLKTNPGMNCIVLESAKSLYKSFTNQTIQLTFQRRTGHHTIPTSCLEHCKYRAHHCCTM